MIFLKEANFEDIDKEYEFVKDMPLDENGLMNQWHGITYDDFKTKALPEMIAYSKGEQLPIGYVPMTFFFLWDDEKIVGQFRLRHYLNDTLKNGAGHIGYFIKNEFRGKGYGKEGLRLIIDQSKKIIPEDEIYLRVNQDNISSLKIMIYNGGYIASEDDDKYFVRIRIK